MPADPAATPDPTDAADSIDTSDSINTADSTDTAGAADAADRHVGSRAELLPEERAVGSDDPAAQAEAILAESRERTEHPDADTSSQSRHASSEDAARRGDPDGGAA
jgi:hypothetical protein